MSKKPKPTVLSQRTVVVVTIDLRRVRWIEPRLRFSEWWRFLFPR